MKTIVMIKKLQCLVIMACTWFALATITACTKHGSDNQGVPQPGDSTGAIDSTDVKPAASKNSIDSVVGTYHGHREVQYIEYDKGIAREVYKYSGPETVMLVRSDSANIRIEFSKFFGFWPNQFTFDTTGELSGFGGGSLTIIPNADSIIYRFYFDDSHAYSGTRTVNSFWGRK